MECQTHENEIEIGVDEAGRGPLFGPVYAAAVVLPESHDDNLFLSIRDSKKLTPRLREKLTEYIERIAITWGVGSASAKEIDEKNILQATFLAMHRALDAAYARARAPFTRILVDGTSFKPYMNAAAEDGWIPHKCIIDGDNTHRHISAASILAKTYHDREIVRLVETHPDLEKYGLLKHKGYGTRAHFMALREYGPSEFHRMSFRGVIN